MKNLLLIALLLLTLLDAGAQGTGTQLVLVGDVHDANTQEPLAYATVALKKGVYQTVSDNNGNFRLLVPADYANDTIRITYIGFQAFEKPIAQLKSIEHVLLKEVATVLEEVMVLHQELDLRNIDRTARPIRGKLYAADAEVTNLEFNQFLDWLDDHNQHDLRLKYDFDLSQYNAAAKSFYKRYHRPAVSKKKRNSSDTTAGFNHYPAVNISYEAAIAYCEWLTARYNENTKRKKFKSVKFRLPTHQEWQIAALGYASFQSWNLFENKIEVVIANDSLSHEMLKGPKKTVVVDSTFLYPWYSAWYFRNKPQNSRNCFLGNFYVDNAVPCPNRALAFDGFVLMAPVRCYFPNNIGLFDVVGNVAEMISDKGKACGGSWNDKPANSTILSVKRYGGPDETVGFRLFIEVE